MGSSSRGKFQTPNITKPKALQKTWKQSHSEATATSQPHREQQLVATTGGQNMQHMLCLNRSFMLSDHPSSSAIPPVQAPVLKRNIHTNHPVIVHRLSIGNRALQQSVTSERKHQLRTVAAGHHKTLKSLSVCVRREWPKRHCMLNHNHTQPPRLDDFSCTRRFRYAPGDHR